MVEDLVLLDTPRIPWELSLSSIKENKSCIPYEYMVGDLVLLEFSDNFLETVKILYGTMPCNKSLQKNGTIQIQKEIV
jgi:hypothetical protein